MSARKMHVDELDLDDALVERLLANQFPHWAGFPIRRVESDGTDNAIYRIGDELAARLPRLESAAAQVEKEHEWLPKLAPQLPLAIPAPVARGAPGGGYPWSWSVTPWFEGETATRELLPDLRRAAADLARFVAALHGIDPTGGPPPGEHNFGRGVPLAGRDSRTREAIAALSGKLDVDAVTAVWDTAVSTPPMENPPVWIHGDLSPGNLLAASGRLTAVIDFGGMAVGDPATDLMVAWSLFSGSSRDVYRGVLAVDEATWVRGRGWALSTALIYIPYYMNTNPRGVEAAWRTIGEVLADQLGARGPA